MRSIRRASALLVCLLLLVEVLPADSTIHLKTRLFNPPNDLEAHRVGPLLRRHEGSSHFLIQFSSPPSPDQIQELKRRGASILSYVPDAGLVVAAADDISWHDLGLRFAGRLDELDKLSAELSPDLTPDGSGGNYAIVEFHPDVDMDDARALVLERNLQITDRDNMLPTQLLVNGSLEDIERLAEWDEVAYIFPASPELANGDNVRACAGAITAQGPIAQYVLASPGWPETGAPGAAIALNFVFGQLTNKIPAATVQSEILRALTEWTRHANVKFSLGQAATDLRTLNIFFASGAHGDGYPFNGPSVLAHTFYPAPPNPEPIAGDMHFNADESWHTGSSIDLFSVALHEAGHALGLAHTGNPNDVMYPYYKQTTGLSADDIAGVQALYGAPQDAPGSGSPAPTPTATPPLAPPTPAPAALSITIASPVANFTTTASAVSVSGNASGGSGTLHVSWTNDRRGSGAASGSANWNVASLPLAFGDNHIVVTVTDGAAKTASKTILITRNNAPTQPDTTPPTLRITSPGAAMISTSAATISLSGTASDNVGVTAVRWTNTFGGGGDAQGTTNWQISSIPLLVGTNKITVRAFDAAGNAGWQLITVVRR
jgi:Matrixin